MSKYTTSQGHDFSTGDWLDLHFDACKPEYGSMIKSIGIKPGWKVLDAGCGNGRFLDILSELVTSQGEIVAIDLAEENIKAVNNAVEKAVDPAVKKAVDNAIDERGLASKDDVEKIVNKVIDERDLASKSDVKTIVAQTIDDRNLATKMDVHHATMRVEHKLSSKIQQVGVDVVETKIALLQRDDVAWK